MSDLEDDLEDGEIESDEEMPTKSQPPSEVPTQNEDQTNKPKPIIIETTIPVDSNLQPTTEDNSSCSSKPSVELSGTGEQQPQPQESSVASSSSNPFKNKEKAIVAARAAEEFEAAAEALAKSRKSGPNKVNAKIGAQKRKRSLDTDPVRGGIDGEFNFVFVLCSLLLLL